MTTLAPAAVGVVLATLTVFQLLLVFGAPLGSFAWGGQHQVLPPRLRIGSAVSIAVYAVLAAIVLARANLLATSVPEGAERAAAWVVTSYFLLAVGANLASRSKPERAVMTPVAAVLCALCCVVAAS